MDGGLVSVKDDDDETKVRICQLTFTIHCAAAQFRSAATATVVAVCFWFTPAFQVQQRRSWSELGSTTQKVG